MLKNIRQLFGALQGNVRVLAFTEPLWAIPVSWTRVYTSLYMVALGVSVVEIGWITAMGMSVQIVGALLGGHFTDKWGRKQTLMIFDLLCWWLPMLVWLAAQNVWYFALAAFINGWSFMAFPAWNCLLVEETPPDKRSYVFSVIQIIVLGAGLLTPLAGLFVAKYQIITGSRLIYGIALGSIGLMLVLRLWLVRETTVGQLVSSRLGSVSFKDAVQAYKDSFVNAGRDRALVILFLLGTFNMVYMNIWTAYSAVYMTDQRGLGIAASLISILPASQSLVIILTSLLVIPHIRVERLKSWLLLSTLLLSIGMGLFVIAPPRSFLFLTLSVLLTGAGTAIFGPVRDTYFANQVADGERARLVSITSTLGLVLTMPVMPAAGKLYEIMPVVPFAIVLGLLATSAAVVFGLPRQSGYDLASNQTVMP